MSSECVASCTKLAVDKECSENEEETAVHILEQSCTTSIDSDEHIQHERESAVLSIKESCTASTDFENRIDHEGKTAAIGVEESYTKSIDSDKHMKHEGEPAVLNIKESCTASLDFEKCLDHEGKTAAIGVEESCTKSTDNKNRMEREKETAVLSIKERCTKSTENEKLLENEGEAVVLGSEDNCANSMGNENCREHEEETVTPSLKLSCTRSADKGEHMKLAEETAHQSFEKRSDQEDAVENMENELNNLDSVIEREREEGSLSHQKDAEQLQLHNLEASNCNSSRRNSDSSSCNSTDFEEGTQDFDVGERSFCVQSTFFTNKGYESDSEQAVVDCTAAKKQNRENATGYGEPTQQEQCNSFSNFRDNTTGNSSSRCTNLEKTDCKHDEKGNLDNKHSSSKQWKNMCIRREPVETKTDVASECHVLCEEDFRKDSCADTCSKSRLVSEKDKKGGVDVLCQISSKQLEPVEIKGLCNRKQDNANVFGVAKAGEDRGLSEEDCRKKQKVAYTDCSNNKADRQTLDSHDPSSSILESGSEHFSSKDTATEMHSCNTIESDKLCTKENMEDKGNRESTNIHSKVGLGSKDDKEKHEENDVNGFRTCSKQVTQKGSSAKLAQGFFEDKSLMSDSESAASVSKDTICDLCDKEAVKYCKNCQEFYCANCCEQYHSRLDRKRHVIKDYDSNDIPIKTEIFQRSEEKAKDNVIKNKGLSFLLHCDSVRQSTQGRAEELETTWQSSLARECNEPYLKDKENVNVQVAPREKQQDNFACDYRESKTSTGGDSGLNIIKKLKSVCSYLLPGASSSKDLDVETASASELPGAAKKATFWAPQSSEQWRPSLFENSAKTTDERTVHKQLEGEEIVNFEFQVPSTKKVISRNEPEQTCSQGRQSILYPQKVDNCYDMQSKETLRKQSDKSAKVQKIKVENLRLEKETTARDHFEEIEVIQRQQAKEEQMRKEADDLMLDSLCLWNQLKQKCEGDMEELILAHNNQTMHPLATTCDQNYMNELITQFQQKNSPMREFKKAEVGRVLQRASFDESLAFVMLQRQRNRRMELTPVLATAWFQKELGSQAGSVIAAELEMNQRITQSMQARVMAPHGFAKDSKVSLDLLLQPGLEEKSLRLLQGECQVTNKAEALCCVKLVKKLSDSLKEEKPKFSVEDIFQQVRENDGHYEKARAFFVKCDTCWDIYTRHQIFSVENFCPQKKKHIICFDCFAVSLKSMVEKSVEQWGCICCLELFDDADMRQRFALQVDLELPSHLNKLRSLFSDKLNEYTASKSRIFRWCAHCPNGIEWETPEVLPMRCSECMNKTCYSCKKKWQVQHENISCEAFEQWVNDNDPTAQERSVQAHLEKHGIMCPNCKSSYELARGGCMHFKCPRCRHEFCGDCKQRFLKQPGIRGFHCKHTRDCFTVVRDNDVDASVLKHILKTNKIPFDEENVQKTKKCPVIEQKEIDDEKIDKACGGDAPAGHGGMCVNHYKEYLIQEVQAHNIDPAPYYSSDKLQQLLRSHDVQFPHQANKKELLDLVRCNIPCKQFLVHQSAD